MNCVISDCNELANHEAEFRVAEEFQFIKGADKMNICKTHLSEFSKQKSFLRSREL